MLNKIHVDDAIHFLKQLEDDSIDMILSSPPYDELRTYKGIAPFTWKALSFQFNRVIKPGRAIIMVIQDACVNGARTGTSFRMVVDFLNNDLRLWECLIYHRIGVPMSGQRFRLEHEYMPVFFKGEKLNVCNNAIMRVKRNNQSVLQKDSSRRQKDGSLGTQKKYNNNDPTKNHGTIFEYEDSVIYYNPSCVDTRKEKLFHPATFPDKLASDMISVFTNKNDVVLDCFMGSGTTAIQAKKLHRNYIGCDVSEEYVTRATELLKTTQKGLL